MATPTPSSQPSKSVAGGQPNAATPQSHAHLAAFSSPAPRSVPSPAAHRGQQSAKSPLNAATYHSSAGTAAALNHPTGGSSASGPRLLGSSPAGVGLGTDSPAAMAFSMSGFDGAGGLGMAFSMSNISGMNLGGTLSAKGRADDEERRKRLEQVVELLRSRPGRISPEGLELLAKRSGLDTDVGTNKREGTTDIAIAGNTVVIEVQFGQGVLVNNVSVQLPTSAPAVQEHYKSASNILRKTLSMPSREDTMTATLAKFAKNLDQLGRMDKLSKLNGNFDCFEAVAGVYSSLKRLYDHEKAVAMALLDSAKNGAQEKAAREVMCNKSGRPAMNERDSIGLRLDYWMPRRHVLPTQERSKSLVRNNTDSAMEIDVPEPQPNEPKEDVLSILVECEASPPAPLELQYPAVRISKTWIGDPVEMQIDESAGRFVPALDWLEPPDSYLPDQTASHDVLQIPGTSLGKKPNVRFVAKLDPPLVVPYQVAVSILHAVGAPIPDHFNMNPRTYPGLVIQPNTPEDLSAVVVGELEKLRSDRSVLLPTVQRSDTAEMIHKNALFVFLNKLDDAPALLGVKLEQFPFFHPRQIVELLPTLRQYAFLNTLLATSFPKAWTKGQPYPNGIPALARSRRVDISYHPSMVPRIAISFDSIGGGLEDALLADVMKGSDSQNSSPRATAQLDDVSGGLEIDILQNAEIQIYKQDLVPVDEAASTSDNLLAAISQTDPKVGAKIAKALSITEDVDIWIEWLVANKERLR